MLFLDIWDHNKTQLQLFILSKVNDQELTMDILQDVGLKLHEQLNKDSDIKNVKAWLYQVTRNTIADHFRKEVKLMSLDVISFNNENYNEPCVCDLSGFVIQNFLPEEYGKPLYMSDVEQLPQQEIADALNLSLTATKSRIQRGRKKMKSLVEECVEIFFNQNGQIADYKLKDGCVLPKKLMDEMERINLVI